MNASCLLKQFCKQVQAVTVEVDAQFCDLQEHSSAPVLSIGCICTCLPPPSHAFCWQMQLHRCDVAVDRVIEKTIACYLKTLIKILFSFVKTIIWQSSGHSHVGNLRFPVQLVKTFTSQKLGSFVNTVIWQSIWGLGWTQEPCIRCGSMWWANC